MRKNGAKNHWSLEGTAARVMQTAFPHSIKTYRELSPSTLYHARGDGGALTTVARMILATREREHAEAISEFVRGVVDARHPKDEYK